MFTDCRDITCKQNKSETRSERHFNNVLLRKQLSMETDELKLNRN